MSARGGTLINGGSPILLRWITWGRWRGRRRRRGKRRTTASQGLPSVFSKMEPAVETMAMRCRKNQSRARSTEKGVKGDSCSMPHLQPLCPALAAPPAPAALMVDPAGDSTQRWTITVSILKTYKQKTLSIPHFDLHLLEQRNQHRQK